LSQRRKSRKKKRNNEKEEDIGCEFMAAMSVLECTQRGPTTGRCDGRITLKSKSKVEIVS
jgi:hypothetical protein